MNLIFDKAKFKDEQITFKNLSPWFWVNGTIVQNSNKHNGKPIKQNARGVKCGLGYVEANTWKALTLKLVEKEGDREIFECLLMFFDRLDKQSKDTGQTTDCYIKALFAYTQRLYDDKKWFAYVTFNREFRPEVLDERDIVKIITKCCKIECETTKNQLTSHIKNRTLCPICGQWVEYHKA